MSILNLHEAFQGWRKRRVPLVLVTVIATEGSTYSKPGAQMLVTADGKYQGLLSGGCLEGDVVEHARQVFETGEAKVITYDMRDEEEDQLWGLGLGCNGMMTIMLQRLSPENGYEPFGSIARHIGAAIPASLALVVESDAAGIKPGAAMVMDAVDIEVFGLPAEIVPAVKEETRERLMSARARMGKHDVPGGSASILYARIPMPMRLLILGGGPDAMPVVALADRLGWRVTVADHRPGYLENLAAGGAKDVRHVDPAALTDVVDVDDYDGAVIMSHHLQTDIAYLRALATSRVPYIGLLGPRARRTRLVEDAGATSDSLQDRIYGPIGLDIGAETPEGIALAIVSELHAVTKGRTGRHLSTA